MLCVLKCEREFENPARRAVQSLSPPYRSIDMPTRVDAWMSHCHTTHPPLFSLAFFTFNLLFYRLPRVEVPRRNQCLRNIHSTHSGKEEEEEVM